MIIEIMKKVLASIIIATFLVVYAAPMGLCVAVAAQIDAGTAKPVLRGPGQPSSIKLEGDVSISKRNPKISLSLRDSDVKQVLRMIADKAGLNIIFHSSVDSAGSSSTTASGSSSSSTSASAANGSSGPKITLDLVNVPLNDAFKMILQVSGLTYYLDHNTIIVASAAAAQTLNLAKQELMIIPVKYVDASAMANFLNKNIFSINKPGLSNAQIAVTNQSTNEILIFGTKNDYLMAKKIVEQFDKKPLEETFIVNHTTPKEMADLLCNTLLKSYANSNNSNGITSTTSGSGTTSTGSSGNSNGTTSTNNSGSSSGTTSTNSGNSDNSISLGEGIVACQYNNSVDTGSISSLNTANLTVTYFVERGSVSVMGGSEQQMTLIKDFIAKNDKKQPQAYLELSIIELNESGSREFNNTWNVWSGFFNGSFNGSTATNPQFPNFIQGDDVTVYDTAENKYVPLYKLGRYAGPMTVTYTMNYLIKNGKGRVLANPRIMITNGKTSKIDLSSDYVKKVTSQYIDSASLAPTIQKTYEIGNDEGIVIEMVPFISPEGYVTLNIVPEYATVKQEVKEKNASTGEIDLVATLLQRRNLDLKNVRIKDGETLVIGGMIREKEAKNVDKFPVLGDLPGIGMFFRNTSTTKSKEELVIMITPKIIKDSEDIINSPGTTL